MTTHRLLGCMSQKAAVQNQAVMVFGIAGRDDHRLDNRTVAFCKVRSNTPARPVRRGIGGGRC
jgi:hypothetical protein